MRLVKGAYKCYSSTAPAAHHLHSHSWITSHFQSSSKCEQIAYFAYLKYVLGWFLSTQGLIFGGSFSLGNMWNVKWHSYMTMWLRLVGSLKLYVSFAKEPYKRDIYSAKETKKNFSTCQITRQDQPHFLNPPKNGKIALLTPVPNATNLSIVHF